MKDLRWRIIITCLVALWGVIYVLPSIPGIAASPLAKILPKDMINLGLDLKGGIHLTLGVEVEKAIENSAAQTASELRAAAKEKGVFILKPQVDKSGRLQFVLPKADEKDTLEAVLKETVRDYSIEERESGDGKISYALSMKPEARKRVADMALDQAVKTIRNRVDQFGVAEPDIRKQQDYRIQIQLPGLDDTKRAIQVLGKTAHLEFKLVDEEADPAKAQKGIVPAGSELNTLLKRMENGKYSESPIVLKKDAAMTGEYITDAVPSFDNQNRPYVSMTFNNRGARLFERLSGENIHKRLAIVLDGKVYSAPVIQDRIAGGKATITGNFTIEEARDLSIVLRAGALPAPVKVLEERTVGPSLGQESIDAGLMAGLIGSVLVVCFMVIYYGFAGFVADIVLVLNVLLLMAGLAAFGATLTLPGIAGIILTIGMAVDANVLIYERIREELRKGLTVRAAIDEGYKRATLTIVDANLTTIITAVILYQFGTGPVRGFAVTLTLGIIASMFTAVFVTRILFDLWTKYRPAEKLSI